jgi:hypothetical protein
LALSLTLYCHCAQFYHLVPAPEVDLVLAPSMFASSTWEAWMVLLPCRGGWQTDVGSGWCFCLRFGLKVTMQLESGLDEAWLTPSFYLDLP